MPMKYVHDVGAFPIRRKMMIYTEVFRRNES